MFPATITFRLIALLAGVVKAAPKPQNIEFDLVYAQPVPTFSIDQTATAQIINYDPTAVFKAAIPLITAAAEINNADFALHKRAPCEPQPAGAQDVPSVPNDDAASFRDSPDFANIALNAATPAGWTQTFSNLNAANNAYGYLGFNNLDSYDVEKCTAQCSAKPGCMAVNIYFERQPSLEPGAACPKPASVTGVKCVYWGSPLVPESATNRGQMRFEFETAVAGSNGYQNNAINTPNGYNTPVFHDQAAINAPRDEFGCDTYLGVTIFDGPFDISLCAKACDLKSEYNLRHPPKDGSPVKTCQFFNTYIIYINHPSNVQGQYCAMYSQSWPASFATNKGQTRGQDRFLIQNSYSASNKANPGGPNKECAVRQMSKDVAWHTLQPYCSTLLGYDTPSFTTVEVSTVTKTATTTETTTVVVGKESPGAKMRRRDSLPTAAPAMDIADLDKRQAAATTPAVLTKYPPEVQSSACSFHATPWTTTATSTTTETVATTVTTVVTATATGFRLKIVDPPHLSGIYFKWQGRHNHNSDVDLHSLLGGTTAKDATVFAYKHIDRTFGNRVVALPHGRQVVIGREILRGPFAAVTAPEPALLSGVVGRTHWHKAMPDCSISAQDVFSCRDEWHKHAFVLIRCADESSWWVKGRSEVPFVGSMPSVDPVLQACGRRGWGHVVTLGVDYVV